jgi:hypothetical protein
MATTALWQQRRVQDFRLDRFILIRPLRLSEQAASRLPFMPVS